MRYLGLIGGLLEFFLDRLLTKKQESPDQGPVSNPSDDVVFEKMEFSKNKVSAAPRSGSAMIEGRFGDWKFTLSSGKRYHFIFDDLDQLNLAIPALIDHFAEAIEVNAKWSERHKRYIAARRWPFR